MGQCISRLPGTRRTHSSTTAPTQQHSCCEIARLPHAVLVHGILALLPQAELLQTVPLVCTAWHQAAGEALRGLALNLSSAERQVQLPHMLTWLAQHGPQLKQLKLSSSTPLGRASRKALLRTLCNTTSTAHGSSSTTSSSLQQLLLLAGPRGPDQPASTTTTAITPPKLQLQLRELWLQLDLDVADLLFLAWHLVPHAPQLHSLKLQPLKPSLADLQLLVLACIVGNLVGASATGPVLPHLTGCGAAVASLAAAATQLRALSLSRYDLESVACVTAARQLTSLALLQCSLTDSSLAGLRSLSSLQRLELADNNLTCAGLREIAQLSHLTHLDLSVLPSRQRMVSAPAADITPLVQLRALVELNLIGFGVADVSALGQMRHLARLEVGLNPLNISSMRTIGQIKSLKHLELGGVSQAWMLSSGLPPADVTMRGQALAWTGLSGLQSVTALDLGGSCFNNQLWVGHMCPLLAQASSLKRLMLAHCSIPTGKLQYLLPQLSTTLVDLNIDRCPGGW